MKKLVPKNISITGFEEETRKFTKDPDVKIQKEGIQKVRNNDPVDQPRLVVKQGIDGHGIPKMKKVDCGACLIVQA